MYRHLMPQHPSQQRDTVTLSPNEAWLSWAMLDLAYQKMAYNVASIPESSNEVLDHDLAPSDDFAPSDEAR